MKIRFEFNQIVGTNIRCLREARGLTQRQLAALIAMSQQQLQKYEAGRDRIAAATLYKIAVILECSMESFFSETCRLEADMGFLLRHRRF